MHCWSVVIKGKTFLNRATSHRHDFGALQHRALLQHTNATERTTHEQSHSAKRFALEASNHCLNLQSLIMFCHSLAYMPMHCLVEPGKCATWCPSWNLAFKTHQYDGYFVIVVPPAPDKMCPCIVSDQHGACITPLGSEEIIKSAGTLPVNVLEISVIVLLKLCAPARGSS